MIRRIVKLTFKEAHIEDFKSIFEQSKNKIVKSKGCHAVDLLQHANQPHIFFTFSLWESEDDLNNYRHSELFQQTWKKSKALFDDKPEAWSTELLSGARKGE
ncbi:MAG: quinol monooxygenase YgiN [Maribacter sp.]|jgi:quinol monooxygenase YgiN